MNDYLLYEALETAHRVTTVGTYAAALYDYFSFLEAHGLAWDEIPPLGSIVPTHLARYRDWSADLRDTFGEPRLKPRTINLYLRACGRFYAWAGRTGRISVVPQAVRTRFDSTRSTGPTPTARRELLLNTGKARFTVLSTTEIGNFMLALSDEQEHAMAAIAFDTGLRRIEIQSFPEALVFDPISRGLSPAKRIPILIEPMGIGAADEPIMATKNGRERRVTMSFEVMRLLFEFRAFGQRVPREKAYYARYNAHPRRLFLSPQGKPLSQRYLNKVFERGSKRSGVRVHPHKARHAFATHYLHHRSKLIPLGQAALELKELLGHGSLSSTQVYIDALHELTTAEFDRHNEMIDALIGREKRK
ncbi:MAG TPA: site-specific integrase [Verrucomicrobiae bacterium]|nr:site-specific integrase [Verrucomicrobiae bacterium]